VRRKVDRNTGIKDTAQQGRDSKERKTEGRKMRRIEMKKEIKKEVQK
jgi:hypothetical protein